MKNLFFPVLGLILGGLVGVSQLPGHSHSPVGAIADILAVLAGSLGGLFLGIVIAICDVVDGKKKSSKKTRKGPASTPENMKGWLHGLSRCPRSGLWTVRAKHTHALAKQFNDWQRIFNVGEGSPFPNPSDMLKGVEKKDVKWQWIRPARNARTKAN